MYNNKQESIKTNKENVYTLTHQGVSESGEMARVVFPCDLDCWWQVKDQLAALRLECIDVSHILMYLC